MKKVDDTRSRLLEAAVEVIESGGISAVRVRDISAAAGVTYASLYHFFGGRDGLIAAAQVERYKCSILDVASLYEEELKKCRNKREFKSVWKRALGVIFHPDRSSQRMTRINVLGACQTRPELREQIAEAQNMVNRQLADIFRPAQLKGWIRQDLDLETFFAWYSGMVTGRVLVEIDPGFSETKTWDSIAIEAILHALFGDS